MSWRSDLVARLRGDATLAGLLGTRIAFFEAARGWGSTLPQLVLQEVSVTREHTHSSGHDGLDEVRVQFDIYAAGGVAAGSVEAALLAELEQEAVTQGSTRFGYGFLQDRGMSTEDMGDGSRAQRLRMDFQFFHETV